jgi:hypothetical protein
MLPLRSHSLEATAMPTTPKNATLLLKRLLCEKTLLDGGGMLARSANGREFQKYKSFIANGSF